MPSEQRFYDVAGGFVGGSGLLQMESSTTVPDPAAARARPTEGATSSISRTGGPARTFRYRALKRCLDLLLVVLISPLLAVAFLIVAAAVRLNSPGPVFYSHRRIGHDQKFFSMWKFRSMCMNSDEVLEKYLSAHPEARSEWLESHKLRNDPRVTKIGYWLRRTSLDELPQVWNVLNGTMSLVGPRPIVSAEVEKYGESFVDYCTVKPGVTGLWQVSGRSGTTYEERIRMDRTYARTWSLRGDVVILVKTLRAVMKQEGAY